MKLSSILKNRTKDTIFNITNSLNNDEIVDFSELYSNLFLDIKPNPKNNYISDAKIIIMYVRYHYFLSLLNKDLAEFYKNKFRDMIYDECEDNTFELGRYVVDMKNGMPNIYDKLNDRVVPKLFIMFYENIGDEVDNRSLENKDEIEKVQNELDQFIRKEEFDNIISEHNKKNQEIIDKNTLIIEKFKFQQFRINSLGLIVLVLIIAHIVQLFF